MSSLDSPLLPYVKLNSSFRLYQKVGITASEVWQSSEMATTTSLIPHALLQCDFASPPQELESNSLLFEFGWTLDCFNQETTMEVMLSDFLDWSMKDEAASILLIRMLILGALSHHVRDPTSLRLPCCEEAKPHWETMCSLSGRQPGRQTLRWSLVIPTSWYSCPCIIPYHWARERLAPNPENTANYGLSFLWWCYIRP